MCRHRLFLCFVLLTSSSLYAQEVVSSDGNYASNLNGSLSWTLGEVITETFEDQSSYLTQGFQQVSLGAAGSPNNMLDMGVSVYPNPFTSYINVSGAYTNSPFTLRIYDSQLRLVLDTEVSFSSVNDIVVVPLKQLSSGLYILSMHGKNSTEIFHQRILKN